MPTTERREIVTWNALLLIAVAGAFVYEMWSKPLGAVIAGAVLGSALTLIIQRMATDA